MTSPELQHAEESMMMQYDVSFGRLAGTPRTPLAGTKFRLALMGDFSSRGSVGTVEVGATLAKRRPTRVDVDTLDDVLARHAVRLVLPFDDEMSVEVTIADMDAFHPDQLVESVPLLERLVGLRRRLSTPAGFEKAAREVLSWTGEKILPEQQVRHGHAIPTDCRLSDFARLTGRETTQADTNDCVDALIRRIVGPHVQPERDGRQDRLTALVEEALGDAMRRILHHPIFQAAEAAWRGVEFLVRRLETDARLEVVLYDVSADELAADLAGADTLEETGLYSLLDEQPLLDTNQGAISAVIGLYGFEMTPPHADLLGRTAQLAALVGAPFVAAIHPEGLQTKLRDQHPMIYDAWTALQALPAAAYLGLVSPRFLLRMPYGHRSDPIDTFAFEEFTRRSGLSGMLWAHPGMAVGLLLAQAWKRDGAKMNPGSGPMIITDMPYFVYTDADGEQMALPCTERLWGERQAVQAAEHRVMPLLSVRGSPQLRLGGFASVGGDPLAGFWAPKSIVTEAPVAVAASPTDCGSQPEIVTRPVEVVPQDIAVADIQDPQMIISESTVQGDTLREPHPAFSAPLNDMDELDALLAGLNADASPTAPGDTEADLDALLNSL